MLDLVDEVLFGVLLVLNELLLQIGRLKNALRLRAILVHLGSCALILLLLITASLQVVVALLSETHILGHLALAAGDQSVRVDGREHVLLVYCLVHV